MKKLFAVLLLLVVGLVAATTAEPAQAAGKPGKITDVTYNVSGAYLIEGTVFFNPVKGTDCLNVAVYIGDGGPAVIKSQRGLTPTTAYVVGNIFGCTLNSSIGYSFTASQVTPASGAILTQGEADVYVTAVTYYSSGRTVSVWTEGPFTYSPTS